MIDKRSEFKNKSEKENQELISECEEMTPDDILWWKSPGGQKSKKEGLRRSKGGQNLNLPSKAQKEETL